MKKSKSIKPERMRKNVFGKEIILYSGIARREEEKKRGISAAKKVSFAGKIVLFSTDSLFGVF